MNDALFTCLKNMLLVKIQTGCWLMLLLMMMLPMVVISRSLVLLLFYVDKAKFIIATHITYTFIKRTTFQDMVIYDPTHESLINQTKQAGFSLFYLYGPVLIHIHTLFYINYFTMDAAVVCMPKFVCVYVSVCVCIRLVT